jgi:hypothetical protein
MEISCGGLPRDPDDLADDDLIRWRFAIGRHLHDHLKVENVRRWAALVGAALRHDGINSERFRVFECVLSVAVCESFEDVVDDHRRPAFADDRLRGAWIFGD